MKQPAPALEHGLNILVEIVRHGRASFSDLQKATGINANTLNRCLVTLCNLGFVEKREDLKYRPGLRISIFDGAANVYQQMKKRARPIMEAYTRKYDVTTILHGVQDDHIYVLDKVMSPVNLAMNDVGNDLNAVGEHVITPWGLLRMAVAKASLEDARQALIEVTSTRREVFDVDSIMRAYEETRRNGYCVDNYRFVDTMERAAFPIFGPEGALLGILGMGSFRGFLTGPVREEIIRGMLDEADSLSAWK